VVDQIVNAVVKVVELKLVLVLKTLIHVIDNHVNLLLGPGPVATMGEYAAMNVMER